MLPIPPLQPSLRRLSLPNMDRAGAPRWHCAGWNPFAGVVPPVAGRTGRKGSRCEFTADGPSPLVGATPQACEVPTNDLFDFQHGALQDRVDDTNIPLAGMAAAKNNLRHFDSLLI